MATFPQRIATLALTLAATYSSPSFAQNVTPDTPARSTSQDVAKTTGTVKDAAKDSTNATVDNAAKDATKDTTNNAVKDTTNATNGASAKLFADLEEKIKETALKEGNNWTHYSYAADQMIRGCHYIAAIAYARKALELNKDAIEPLENMGLAYTFLGRDKPSDERKAFCGKAITTLQEAIDKSKKQATPNDKKIAYFYVIMGDAQAHTSQLTEAVRSYRNALKLDPDNRGASMGLNWIDQFK